ncbi:hypothetical protein SAMN02990966_07756 [Rhodospirillales bacterium URHD0017]|nr:hypothetical protein SAMN02990966_07756 [Rhodospirillales bacterium URHD0017]
MRCTIHPATAQDVARVVIGHDSWSRDAGEGGLNGLDALLEACAMSRQVWTASNAAGDPLAFIGAAPWADDAGRGRLWFIILAAYDGNDADLKSVMRLTVGEMLQEFGQLENHVSSEKAWALELMREAGFTVAPAHPAADGVCRHRVWIDADAQGSAFSAA